MILLALVVSFSGAVRLSRFYDRCPTRPSDRLLLLRALHARLAARCVHRCSFLDVSEVLGSPSTAVYRTHNRMFVTFVVDDAESPLAIFDLIDEFLDAVQTCVGSGGELDFLFHSDLVHHLLNEVVQGGMVVASTSAEVKRCYREQRDLVAEENKTLLTSALEAMSSLAAFSAVHPM